MPVEDERSATEGGPDAGREVAVVGLGAMGLPIARHLALAGYRPLVTDLDESRVGAAVAAGAVAATAPAWAARAAVVLVVVPTDDDVRSVCLGPEGLVHLMAPRSVLVISASVLPQTCGEIEAVAAERGVDVLDAALTGGVRGAEAGRVNVLVGGDEAVLERVRPVLEPFAHAVHHLGALGSGQVAKTVNNLCHWVQIAGVHEALLLGQRLGVRPSRLRAAIADGPAHSGTMAQIEQMRLTWWRKDLANARAMASLAGQRLPLAEFVESQLPEITVERLAALVADRDPDQARLEAR